MLIFDQLRDDDPHLRTMTWGVLAGVLILLAGLYYVQVVSYRHYAENQKAQSFRTVRIPAIRGKIFDRQGQALAENQPAYNAMLYLEELRPIFKQEWKRSAPRGKLKRSERTALEWEVRYRVASNIVHQLSQIVQQPLSLDYGRFLKHYTNQLALPLPIMTNLTPAQVARLQEHPGNLPGLDLEVQPIRFYPFGATAAHVLGFLIRDDSSVQDEEAFFNYRLPDYRGLVGIEGAFDRELRGKAGVKSVLVNNLGYRQSETVWTAAEPGRNVLLTLDLKIQQTAEQALQKAMPNVRGAVVVMDPNNGDILALASAPAYDPNLFIPRVSYEYWKHLSDENLKPQRNRATQENYAPGSIFKIIVGLACLEAGLNPRETIYNPGYIQVGRGRAPINDLAPAGTYDFRRAFVRSSNTYFITNGLKAGVENIIRLGERFKLGERTELPTRQETPGNFPSWRRIRAGWFDGHTANLCIGQGEIAVTPLQMAVMTSAIANGGNVYWPRLVQQVEPQDPTSGHAPVVVPPGRVRGELGVSARSLKLVREAMLADVEDRDEGTGRAAAVPGLRICGKTGTAQVTDDRNRLVDQITWFTSYAPYEQPRYVVVVMVESGQSGGGTCAPVAQRIYQVLQYEMSHAKPPAVAQMN